jgi:hypothetical protein
MTDIRTKPFTTDALTIRQLKEILRCIVVEMVSILSNYGVIRND